MSDTRQKIIKSTQDYLSNLTSDDIKSLWKRSHPHTFDSHCILFLYLRDHLTRENFRRNDIVKYQDDLLMYAQSREREVKQEDSEKRKAELEKQRLEKYASFTGDILKKDDMWYNCKVEKVTEIMPSEVYGNWDEWKRLRLSAGKKAQIVTLASGEELIATFTKTARGIRAFDIIDCKVENNRIYIVSGSVTGDFGDFVARPIAVTVREHGKAVIKQFGSVASAYRYIQPAYSYGTVCKNTKKATSQEEIDNIFYGQSLNAHGTESVYRH